uniref:Uncharacterized protein n=1 Tax=Lygus hesperus TaxID=30085 RepID=A0A0A9ZCR1_LYGHE
MLVNPEDGIFHSRTSYSMYNNYSESWDAAFVARDQLRKLQSVKGRSAAMDCEFKHTQETAYQTSLTTPLFLLSWFPTPPSNANVLFFNIRKRGRRTNIHLYSSSFIRAIVSGVRAASSKDSCDADDTNHCYGFIKCIPNVIYIDSLEPGQQMVALTCAITSLLLPPSAPNREH